jgi:hypothetical protein
MEGFEIGLRGSLGVKGVKVVALIFSKVRILKILR